MYVDGEVSTIVVDPHSHTFKTGYVGKDASKVVFHLPKDQDHTSR